MKKIILTSVFFLIALVLSGCSLYKNSQNNAPSAAITTQSPDVTDNVVEIKNFSFIPATLIVKKGATVKWINKDSAPHQIKSSTFNSEKLNVDQSFSFTFDNVGNFDYICGIHPSMIGKIVVE